MEKPSEQVLEQVAEEVPGRFRTRFWRRVLGQVSTEQVRRRLRRRFSEQELVPEHGIPLKPCQHFCDINCACLFWRPDGVPQYCSNECGDVGGFRGRT